MTKNASEEVYACLCVFERVELVDITELLVRGLVGLWGYLLGACCRKRSQFCLNTHTKTRFSVWNPLLEAIDAVKIRLI